MRTTSSGPYKLWLQNANRSSSRAHVVYDLFARYDHVFFLRPMQFVVVPTSRLSRFAHVVCNRMTTAFWRLPGVFPHVVRAGC